MADPTQASKPATSIASARSVRHIAVPDKLQEATLSLFRRRKRTVYGKGQYKKRADRKVSSSFDNLIVIIRLFAYQSNC